jgi:hypothetical protein
VVPVASMPPPPPEVHSGNEDKWRIPLIVVAAIAGARARREASAWRRCRASYHCCTLFPCSVSTSSNHVPQLMQVCYTARMCCHAFNLPRADIGYSSLSTEVQIK